MGSIYSGSLLSTLIARPCLRLNPVVCALFLRLSIRKRSELRIWDTMALVSGGTSRLNPNAPVYIPAALRQVEDFSPEWWNLISTSVWFRDYWVSQHQEVDPFYVDPQENFVGGDIADLLPDDIDLGVDEEVLNMESQFEEFILSTGNRGSLVSPKTGNKASRYLPVAYEAKPAKTTKPAP